MPILPPGERGGRPRRRCSHTVFQRRSPRHIANRDRLCAVLAMLSAQDVCGFCAGIRIKSRAPRPARGQEESPALQISQRAPGSHGLIHRPRAVAWFLASKPAKARGVAKGRVGRSSAPVFSATKAAKRTKHTKRKFPYQPHLPRPTLLDRDHLQLDPRADASLPISSFITRSGR